MRNPRTRTGVVARAATAGWHDGRGGRNGWWRHRDGGYGWVGPLFWPFAYYDMYDYAMWGNGYDASFWGYGYADIYAGLFAPYGYDDLTGYLPEYAGASPGAPGQAPPTSTSAATPAAPADAGTGRLASLCGEDSRDIAGLPIDQFQQAIQPNDAQRAALDDLANASVKAAQDIKAACPSDVALTAASRLADMKQRIEAMIAAVQTLQPPLEKFFGLLSDEQKARLTALSQDQLRGRTAAKTTGSLAQSCGASQPGVAAWPTAEIDRTVRPTEAQRASLAVLQNATVKAAALLETSCPADNPLTPPARLAAAGKRLEIMRQAVEMVSAALGDFYGALSDEQKARFEAIGPQRTSQPDQPKAGKKTRARFIGGVGNELRRLLRSF
ncbi:MAG: Spy/CpxP family protein refolding chaperone [Xanthobacteraceae bacterium]